MADGTDAERNAPEKGARPGSSALRTAPAPVWAKFKVRGESESGTLDARHPTSSAGLSSCHRYLVIWPPDGSAVPFCLHKINQRGRVRKNVSRPPTIKQKGIREAQKKVTATREKSDSSLGRARVPLGPALHAANQRTGKSWSAPRGQGLTL